MILLTMTLSLVSSLIAAYIILYNINIITVCIDKPFLLTKATTNV